MKYQGMYLDMPEDKPARFVIRMMFDAGFIDQNTKVLTQDEFNAKLKQLGI